MQNKQHENMPEMGRKKRYSTPQIKDIGKLTNIIQGISGGSSDVGGLTGVLGTEEPPPPFP